MEMRGYGAFGIGRDAQRRSLFDLGYFDSRDEAQDLLERIGINESKPLVLPEYPVVMQMSSELGIEPKRLLLAYQKLKQSDQSDVFCGWKNPSGKRCGGLTDQEVTPLGVYYQCRLYADHRTKK